MCNMKEKLMHKYALSSQGAKDMIKAFISVTISDLILMIPVSLLWKGIFLNFSASVIRLTPLSTYVDKNVALYWIYVDTAINTSVIITPAI